MTPLVNPDSTDHVLEIDIGSGYESTVLASIVNSVHALAVIPELDALATGRLLDQLTDGGRRVVPEDPTKGTQGFTLVTKNGGEITRQALSLVRFVPFLRPEN
ncbi:hypothetical protein [Salinibacter altiplanensis]|uniref:hypothetical protein n=1 Tax=Salinibacter altiplanensis TaxID=1803181 RepID=UPI0018F89225|nr:hypothetical protein [Salinibacter altiplanensis]